MANIELIGPMGRVVYPEDIAHLRLSEKDAAGNNLYTHADKGLVIDRTKKAPVKKGK